jgi:hypothetical protein
MSLILYRIHILSNLFSFLFQFIKGEAQFCRSWTTLAALLDGNRRRARRTDERGIVCLARLGCAGQGCLD